MKQLCRLTGCEIGRGGKNSRNHNAKQLRRTDGSAVRGGGNRTAKECEDAERKDGDGGKDECRWW